MWIARTWTRPKHRALGADQRKLSSNRWPSKLRTSPTRMSWVCSPMQKNTSKRAKALQAASLLVSKLSRINWASMVKDADNSHQLDMCHQYLTASKTMSKICSSRKKFYRWKMTARCTIKMAGLDQASTKKVNRFLKWRSANRAWPKSIETSSYTRQSARARAQLMQYHHS